MIDLHLHSTASDGHQSPAELMRAARAAGLTVLSLTDHDTTAGTAEAAAAAAQEGLEFVAGIEITAVIGDTDVHVLGYFIDAGAASLAAFLARQREARRDRVRAMAERLAGLGVPIDAGAIIAGAETAPGSAVGRPHIAHALVRAGHVGNVREAFDLYLGEGKAAYVGRTGASPREVVELILASGGLASLAHPGLLGRDDLIADLTPAGLSALEAYHSDHDAQTREHYLRVARAHGLAVSGGSDYHGDPAHGAAALGSVALPAEEFERLKARAKRAP